MHELPYSVNMNTVNESIREEVRVALARRDMTQADLAEKLGISRQYLNAYLRGKAGDVPKLWEKVFGELELELVVRSKDA